jgi:hypothetical protein
MIEESKTTERQEIKSGLAYTFRSNVVEYPQEAINHRSNPRNFLARERVDYVLGQQPESKGIMQKGDFYDFEDALNQMNK